MTDELDPRRRAADYRHAATRNRRQADQIDLAITHPSRHPPPATRHWNPSAALLALYARHPHLGHRAAQQHRQLADRLDRAAAQLLTRRPPP